MAKKIGPKRDTKPAAKPEPSLLARFVEWLPQWAIAGAGLLFWRGWDLMGIEGPEAGAVICLVAAGLLLVALIAWTRRFWLEVAWVYSLFIFMSLVVFFGWGADYAIHWAENQAVALDLKKMVSVAPRLPDNQEYTIEVDINTEKELRAVDIEWIPSTIQFSSGWTVKDIAFGSREYVPSILGSYRTGLKKPNPREQIGKADVILHLQFAIVGLPGRYWIGERYILVHEDKTKQRWDVHEQARGRLFDKEEAEKRNRFWLLRLVD